jgi:hypothetical protein
MLIGSKIPSNWIFRHFNNIISNNYSNNNNNNNNNEWITQSLSCWPKIPRGSRNNAIVCVVNFHRDFVVGTHRDLFKGQTNRGLTYWPNNSEDTPLVKREEGSEIIRSSKGCGRKLEVRNVYEIGSCAKCYKTFFLRNLGIFVIS